MFIALDDDEGEIYNALKTHGATVSKSVIKATKVLQGSYFTSTFSQFSIISQSYLGVNYISKNCL